MSSQVPRTKVDSHPLPLPRLRRLDDPTITVGSDLAIPGSTTSKLLRSEGHPVNRKTGKRESGGPFYMVRTGTFIEPGHVTNVCNPTSNRVYTGPVVGPFESSAAVGSHYNGNPPSDYDEKSLNADGTTAIAQCAPTNPTAGLATGLAEIYREGFPTLPGIQTWKKRTEYLKSLGSEYLNYQFGWAPLHQEVTDVVNAARNHRDIMSNYRRNEGKNVHRRFDFSPEIQRYEEEIPPLNPILGRLSSGFLYEASKIPAAPRRNVVEITRNRWFEGCFTYGGPGKADSFARHIGFGSEADAVYGLNLSPEILWELTPWSWAVDWFTNAQDVISNISSFVLAGLVMRYGFMMEETIEKHYTSWDDGRFNGCVNMTQSSKKFRLQKEGSGSRGIFTVTKARIPANPFGFGVGWEGLSPTQLAITAAIGITRLL